MHVFEKYGRALTAANLIQDEEKKLFEEEKKLFEEEQKAEEVKAESGDKKIGLFTAPQKKTTNLTS